MPSHPEIQARAHEELDRVVGRKHWPTTEDEERLPYCRAIIKEVKLDTSPNMMFTHGMKGTTSACTVLDGNTTLFLGRLRLQRSVYPEGHGHGA
jgi:hypothetical protein